MNDGRWNTIAIASDFVGFDLKEELKGHIDSLGYMPLDFGTYRSDVIDDYPDFANRLSCAILRGRAKIGVLICGTGIGISIAANRHRGIRAALCHDITSVKFSRKHNDANVLALGARIIGRVVARECLETFIATPFEGGDFTNCVAKLDQAAPPFELNAGAE